MMRKGDTAKLPPEQEEAYLNNLKLKREQVARIKLQAEAQAVANKFRDVAVDKLAEDAKAIADKDRKNFGFEQESAVAAITLNAVLLAASAASKEAEASGGKGKGKAGYKPEKKSAGGGKKGAAPKIGAKLEKLPPPTLDAFIAVITEHKKTLVKVSKFNGGQLSLLRAFDAWMLLDINEPMRADVPKYLETFLGESLIEKETYTTYWGLLKAAIEAEGTDLEAAQTTMKASVAEHSDAAEKLKVAETEMADVLQKLKWAEAEVRNARCGNQPTAEEVAREKEANSNEVKMRACKLSQTKVVEMCHKRQVSTLNTRETADRTLKEKTDQMRPLELTTMHGRVFYEGLEVGDSPNKAESVPA